MKVLNVHKRILPEVEQAKVLIDSLASKEDALWPSNAWPRMVFDRPLVSGVLIGDLVAMTLSLIGLGAVLATSAS